VSAAAAPHALLLLAQLPLVVPTLGSAAAGFTAAGALALAWNVTYAGRIAQLRRAPRLLAALSGACGLLVVPAFAAHLAGSTLYGGRAVNSIAWIWPLATLLVLAQALYAVARRFVTPFVGVPLLLYDVLVALVVVARFLVERGVEPPTPLVALSAAQASVLAVVLGPAALASPLAVLVPLLVPAYPARWRLTRAARALLAVGVTALTRLAGPPPALTVRNDVPLVDSLDVDAVQVRLRPDAATLAALDSLNRVLDPARRDSALLVVSLEYAPGDAARRRADPAAFDARRLQFVERVARALRPQVLLPAGVPYGESAELVGRLEVEEWQRYLTAAAERAHAVNRRIRVAVAAGDYGPADSALYVWAASRAAPLDAVGFTIRPSLSGGTGVEARLRAADRWMRAAAGVAPGDTTGAAPAAAATGPSATKEHWVFDVRGFPVVHGAASQTNTVWHTLAWATARPEVAGVIVSEPGDYVDMTGLRAANGRLRPVVASLRRAMRGLREAVAP
jgi:hypothetical protein